jgi:class 3 adenylate cyclase
LPQSLAADVAGYSRLASADEDRTLARLRALRGDLIDLPVSDLGEQSLKNIAEPVRAYALEVGKSAPAKPTERAAPKKRRRFALLAAGIVALVVIATGVWLALRPAKGPEISATAPRLSIVVLRFTNLSGDPSQDYLVEFRSVVDAVRCAVEVQDGMVERNSGLLPERRIEFRIGIRAAL